MRTRNWKVGMLGMLLVAATVAACSKDGPTSTVGIEAPNGPALADDGTISGRLVTTVRSFDGRNLLGTVNLVDTASYAGSLSRGEVRASATSRGERFSLTVAVRGSQTGGAEGGGRRERTSRSPAPVGADYVGVRSATFVQEGAAPVSEMTYRRGAEVVARVATTWVRVQGGWIMRSRTITAFRYGRPTGSVETVLLDHRVEVSSGALGAASVASTDALAVGAALRSAGEGAASEEMGDCRKEFDAMFDALDRYWFASWSVLACGAGPWACFAAATAVMMAGRAVDVAEARLNRCLGGAQ